MNFPRLPNRPSIFSALFAGIFLGGLAYAPQIMAEDLASNQKKTEFRTFSIKCDMKMIPEISTKRLTDCGSATLVQEGDENLRHSAVLFRITPADEKISDGNRAELRDRHEAVNGEETWYRFSTKLPHNFPLQAKHRLVLSQWHERTKPGEKSLRPPLSHRLWDGRFVVTLWNQGRVNRQGLDGDGEILFEIPTIDLGVYYNFIYKVNWSTGQEGRVVGWMRKCKALVMVCEQNPWRKIIDHSGPNGYANVLGYYFKFGLYTVSEFDTAFMAYHKDYHVGHSAQNVGLKNPIFFD